jgi:hypothetical protein
MGMKEILGALGTKFPSLEHVVDAVSALTTIVVKESHS